MVSRRAQRAVRYPDGKSYMVVRILAMGKCLRFPIPKDVLEKHKLTVHEEVEIEDREEDGQVVVIYRTRRESRGVSGSG